MFTNGAASILRMVVGGEPLNLDNTNGLFLIFKPLKCFVHVNPAHPNDVFVPVF